MKVLVLDFMLRVYLDENSSRAIDNGIIVNFLKSKGYTVHIGTKRIEGDGDNIIDYRVVNFDDYDQLYVLSSPVNFFGGQVLDFTKVLLKKFIEYKGRVNVIFIDPKFMFSNIVAHIEGSKKNLQCGFTKEDSEKFANKDYYALTVSDNFEEYNKHFEKRKYVITIKNHEFFPLFELTFKQRKIENKNKEFERKYDIVYWGDIRGTSRQKKLNKLIGTELLYKKIIGFQNEAFAKNTEFFPKCTRTTLFDNICCAYSTIVTGDDIHIKSGQLTYRLFEALQSNMICFIDRKYFSNVTSFIIPEDLKEYLFVEDKKELMEKLTKYKEDKDLFNKIIERQNKFLLSII